MFLKEIKKIKSLESAPKVVNIFSKSDRKIKDLYENLLKNFIKKQM